MSNAQPNPSWDDDDNFHFEAATKSAAHAAIMSVGDLIGGRAATFPHLIDDSYAVFRAPAIEDLQHATDDFLVQNPRQIKIARRVRRPDKLAWYLRYKEFAIRSKAQYNGLTEYDKVLAGYGDFLFYAVAGLHEGQLDAWFVGDLHVFRAWHAKLLADKWVVPWRSENRNPDGTAFKTYRCGDLPAEFVVASFSRATDPNQECLF